MNEMCYITIIEALCFHMKLLIISKQLSKDCSSTE